MKEVAKNEMNMIMQHLDNLHLLIDSSCSSNMTQRFQAKI